MPGATCASRPVAAPDPLAPLRELVERGLRELDLCMPGDLDGFAEAIRYPLLAPGKRLRPVLCLATGEALGVDPAELLPTALALELVHTFSLVHDDLPAMDDERRLAALALLARATGAAGMIGGQYLDVRAPADIGETGLQRLHRLKTGALLEASVGCAVVLAAPGPEVAGALASFAAELGLLFQIVDDVLDATGSDASLGKPAGSDERRGRRTYVTVLGLEGARRRQELCESAARASLSRISGEKKALVAVLERVARRTR